MWQSRSLNGQDIGDGDSVDQPTIGQDRNAFLVGAVERNSADALVRHVTFAKPKSDNV